MTPDTTRIHPQHTHHTVDARGIQSWIEPCGRTRVAVAQVQVPDADGKLAWLKHGVQEPIGMADNMDDMALAVQSEGLIAEAKVPILAALDFIAMHGAAAYEEMTAVQDEYNMNGIQDQEQEDE